MSGCSRRFFLGCLLTLSTLFTQVIGTAAATQRVVVDVGSTKGQAGNPIASGFRAQWANTTPRDLLLPLKPNDVGGPWFWPCEDSVWIWAAATGAKVHMGMGATIPRVLAIGENGDEKEMHKMWMHDDSTKVELMAAWTDHVQRIVRVGEYLRTRTTPPVQVIYEIWNEPDLTGSWNPSLNPNSEISGANPESLFFEVWDAAFHVIKGIDTSLVITGPTLAYNVLGAPGDIDDRSGVQMSEFLKHCSPNNTMPTILGWHDIGNWDYADPDLANEPHANAPGETTDPKWNLQAQVDYAYRLLRGNTPENLHLNQSPGRIPQQFEVNEAMTRPQDVTSGIMVREFALAERARPLGLVNVGRTLWCDPCIGADDNACLALDPNSITLTVTTHLCNLVWPCCDDAFCGFGQLFNQKASVYAACRVGDLLWNKRYAWWTQKAYADLEGTFVELTPTVACDGLAAMASDELRILIGKFAGTSQEDVRVVLKNVHAPLVVNGAVQVLVNRMLGDEANLYAAPDGLAPVFVRDRREIVNGDSCVIEIPWADFGVGDALSIEVTPIVPDSVIARQDFPDIQTAIDSTEVGNTVIVKPREPLGAVHAETIRMRAGVRVVAQLGTLPRISKAGKTLVSFPENANGFTYIDGIQLEASPSSGGLAATESLVVIRGAGSIRNCILKDMGLGSVITGIFAEGHSGEIRNCTIDMTSHAHTSGQAVYGMILGQTGSPNNSHVVNCSINARNEGVCQGWGIGTSVIAQALIESTFVKAQTWGIAVDGTTTVQFCTVDSTYYQGIVGTGTLHTIQNCIATHVLHGSDAGIGGWDLRYCMSPSGFTELGYHIGNVTEDPGYCGPNTYTVKVDSYANPANNPSGKQIGAFPAACVYGALARNVSWNGTKPPLLVPGDVTIPVGKSLTLTNGAVVKCGPGDLHGPGYDALATEIIVDQGALSVSGPSAVHFTSGATPPTPGSWEGIRALGGASVSVDSAVVEYADTGFDLEGSASGSVKRALFRNNLTNDILCSEVGTSTGITLEANRLEAAGSAGIRLRGDTRSVTIKQSTILRSGSSGDGISLTYNNEFATPMITQNSITGFLAGAGISIEGGSPTITKNTISTCATGIKIVSTSFGTPLIGLQGDSQSDNIITANTVGISSQYAGCNPVIRENKIQSNSSGVVAKNGASPNVGASGQAKGNNWFSGNTNYCIWNRNVNGNPQISAKYNYFGVSCDTTQQMPTCWSGNVDISHWLCTAPAGFEGMMAMEALPETNGRSIYAIAPNPALSGTVLTLSVKDTEKDVQVDAFDLAGRRVREVAAGRFPVGLHQISWDGRDQSGTPVSAGIYFFRVRVHGRSDEVARLLVLQKGGAR